VLPYKIYHFRKNRISFKFEEVLLALRWRLKMVLELEPMKQNKFLPNLSKVSCWL